MTGKPLCLACGERPVYCVGRVPLCTECDPHPDAERGGLTFEEHARGCRPCLVFLVWLVLEAEGYPNTHDHPRAEAVRRVLAGLAA